MSYRIAIGPSSFAAVDNKPLEFLEQAGVEIRPNPFGRRLTEEEIINQLDDVDGLIAGLEPLNRRVLRSATKLKAIARVGIGMDTVDSVAAEELGIRVSNTPDGPTDAVAEMCLTALLSIGRKLVPFNVDMHNGKWEKRIGISFACAKVLFLGYGRIGKKFAEILRLFNAEILVCDPNLSPSSFLNGERMVSFDEGLKAAEIITLHASGNQVILNEEAFKKMDKGMILLNSARGELLDEDALVSALRDGTISAAWLDTFRSEPYSGPLCDFDQVILTPHVSTYTKQCRRQMEEDAVRNLFRDLGIKTIES